MALVEDVKKLTERATGWQRPSVDALARLLHACKPRAIRFDDDGKTPNHPSWPVLVYRNVVKLPRSLDPAAVFEDTFARNGWGDSWRDGIYDYLHYHSRIHEVLGIARGQARVRLGGKRGRTLILKAGDAVVLPAGTGHQALAASRHFMVVGAYPPAGTYDECAPTAEEHERALRTVPKVKRPRTDPLFGTRGPLQQLWQLNRK
jgi:uncharacterized protein YjlB